ncbi:MAG: hypothetical protein EA369_04730 [Bradymonadales bacterium]|nr:MAG: hypothetical protein EA369_04730 [Bradymonadales bacterium]
MHSKIELETIAKVIESLNHYQVLKLDPMAGDEEIREAFHNEAISFHPDQYFSEKNPELSELAKKIYSRVVAAYRELSSPELRAAYDKKMNINSGRIESAEEPVDEDAITSVKRKPTWAQKGPGEKFFQLAEKAYASRDLRSALMNVQIALGSEPDNPQYQRFQKELEKQLQKNTKLKK